MKAKKIWVVQHPEEPDNFEVSFGNKEGQGEYMYYEDGRDYGWVDYKEYVLIEVEE